jgi:hypothetical protein
MGERVCERSEASKDIFVRFRRVEIIEEKE